MVCTWMSNFMMSNIIQLAEEVKLEIFILPIVAIGILNIPALFATAGTCRGGINF